jgi:hypothetical protein
MSYAAIPRIGMCERISEDQIKVEGYAPMTMKEAEEMLRQKFNVPLFEQALSELRALYGRIP